MKISEKYGPQFDATDGTIGKLQLVKRFALTNPDNWLVWPARQGRCTYDTEGEAYDRLNVARDANSETRFPEVHRLAVRAVWCYPGHYDPCGPCEQQGD